MRAPGDVLAHAARGDLDRPRKPRAPNEPCGTTRQLAQPEQDRAALLLGVELVAQPAQSGPQQQAAELRAPATTAPRPRTAPSSAADEPSMTFSATLPVKPSATITSAAPVPIAKPSTLPTKFRPVATGSSAVRRDDDLGALGRLRAVGEQRHARRRDAADGLHERRAHVRELDQVLGPDLDVGARVEQQERRARDRDDDRQRRAGARRARA